MSLTEASNSHGSCAAYDNTPSTERCPLLGETSLNIASNNVDLPEPTEPTTVVKVSGFIYVKDKFDVSMSGLIFFYL